MRDERERDVLARRRAGELVCRGDRERRAVGGGRGACRLHPGVEIKTDTDKRRVDLRMK